MIETSGIKPFRVISKSNVTEQWKEDVASFCDKVDYLYVGASDEFFMHTGIPNPKTDFMWVGNLGVSDKVLHRPVGNFLNVLEIFC